MTNWNYEALGFRSQEEMEESIARVKYKAKADSLEYEIERRKKAQDLINENGGIDFKGLEEGARLEELDRVVASKLYEEREIEKQREAQEELNKLMEKAAEQSATEKKEAAEKELRKQKAKAEEELQKEIYSKHGTKTDKEIKEDELYSNMLKGLKLDD